MYISEEMVIEYKKIGSVLAYAIALLCLLVPVFSYAQAPHVSLGTNYSNATLIADTATASVSDGVENYFKIEAEHLPATVYYFPDTAFGPIPELISVNDTLPAIMVSENCRMGWKWTLAAAAEDEGVRYLYFSAHENGATAEIRPYVFTCPVYDITLPAVSACGEYKWSDPVAGDTTIYDSDTYTRHFVAANGCDSTVTLSVTINEASDPTVIRVTAYDKYVWHGATYTSGNGGYVGAWEGKNIAGCDSVVNLFLTIKHLRKDTLRETVCSNNLPFLWRGNSYTEGNTYTLDTVPGATVDTIFTLVLTVNQAYAVDTTAELCGTSFVWRGQTYTQSGHYTYPGKTAAGCDSVVTLHLTLNPPTASEETRTEYESYTWNGKTYTTSGTYTFTTTNAAGCDSVATLHLTIKDRPVLSYDTVYFCAGFNTEHEEQINESLIRRYRRYVYESPATWDYKAGMVVEEQRDRARMDLRLVEKNLYNHYVGELEPITTITWSHQPYGSSSSVTVEPGTGPQWIDAGELVIYVRFTCGHSYQEKTVIVRSAEDVEVTEDGKEQWTKVLIDGQIYIIRGGIKYNIFGTRIE